MLSQRESQNSSEQSRAVTASWGIAQDPNTANKTLLPHEVDGMNTLGIFHSLLKTSEQNITQAVMRSQSVKKLVRMQLGHIYIDAYRADKGECTATVNIRTLYNHSNRTG